MDNEHHVTFSVDHHEETVTFGISGTTIKERFGVEQIWVEGGITPDVADKLADLLKQHAALARNQE